VSVIDIAPRSVTGYNESSARQVKRAEALQQEALHTYEKSSISAFEDVENALVDRTKFEQIRDEQAKNVGALKQFRDLADLRYANLYKAMGGGWIAEAER